jgi:glycosyltransferase involved in cell wall biosynthesis
MKVMHMIDSAGLYGAEKMLLDLVTEQQQIGLSPVILSSTNNSQIKPLVEEAKKRGLETIEWKMKDGLNIVQALKILRYAKNNNVSVFHSHGYKFNILMGLLPSGVRKIPLVSTVHGYLKANKFSKLWLYQWVDRWFLSRAEAAVFVSHAMLKQPAFYSLKINNPQVIYNGIDLNGKQIDDQKSTRLSDLVSNFDSADLRIIGAVGRLSAEKGFDDLVEAFSKLYRSNNSFRLLIVGEGPERDRLQTLIDQRGLSEVVRMPGYINYFSTNFSQLDVLVMSSHAEGMPITLLEAVGANCPIVATQVGGIPEVLEAYPKAKMVPPNAPGKLAFAIKAILVDQSFREKADLENFKLKFSSRSMAENYIQIYRSVDKSSDH